MLKFAFRVTQILAFLDTNMLVSPKQNCVGSWCWLGPLTPGPNTNVFASQWNIGFIVSLQNLRNREEVSAREGAHLQVFHYQ